MHGSGRIGRVGHQGWRARCRDQIAAPGSESDKAINQTWRRIAVESPRIGEQEPPRLGGVAHALGDAGQPGDKRRLERVRQDECSRVPMVAQSASGRAALGEGELAVTNGIVDNAPNAAHARIHGRAPRRRQHVDDRLFQRFAQQGDQRLGQNSVTDP